MAKINYFNNEYNLPHLYPLHPWLCPCLITQVISQVAISCHSWISFGDLASFEVDTSMYDPFNKLLVSLWLIVEYWGFLHLFSSRTLASDFFFFGPLEVASSSLLVCEVSAKKSSVTVLSLQPYATGFLLQVTSCYSPGSIKIILNNLIKLCQ